MQDINRIERLVAEIERQQGVPAKATVVKIYYSHDDQIALMLNYAKNPEQYQAAYSEMQAWRDIAGEVAKKLIGEE